MIKRIILIIGSLAAMTVVATGQEAETLFAGEVVHGGFGGPVLKASTVNGSPALFVGGRGGWIINHSFILGGGGDGLGVGFGDFQVIAEDLVVAHLEGFDAGALAFHRFQAGDPVRMSRTCPTAG